MAFTIQPLQRPAAARAERHDERGGAPPAASPSARRPAHKARRGELWIRPPIGYVFDPRTSSLVLDPDEQIQEVVRLLFETFRRTGSALKVVRYFAAKPIGWPRRVTSGVRAGETVCSPLAHHRMLRVLHNLRYTGAFVFGRTRSTKIPIGGPHRYRRLPRHEWKVFLPDSFPGYISWEQYEANQETLRANAWGYGYDRVRSPAREGAALLQGLVLCGKCGDPMTVRYYVRKGQPLPIYLCQRRSIESAKLPCQVIPGGGLDEIVGSKRGSHVDARTPNAPAGFPTRSKFGSRAHASV